MTKKDVDKRLLELFEERIKVHGFKMSKKISESYSGFFSYTPAHYDERTAYSIEQLKKLGEEGFYVNEDAGLFLFNMIFDLEETVKSK